MIRLLTTLACSGVMGQCRAVSRLCRAQGWSPGPSRPRRSDDPLCCSCVGALELHVDPVSEAVEGVEELFAVEADVPLSDPLQDD